MKKRKGERPRPCRRCRVTVRFMKGAWTAFEQPRHGWHWVNQDGSHHRCGDFIEVGANPTHATDLDMQWRAAMERERE